MNIKNNLDKLIILIFLIVFVIFGFKQKRQEDNINNSHLYESAYETIEETEEEIQENISSQTMLETIIEEYYVDVSGCVIKPGVYSLNSNSRVVDAIELAGGVCEKADLSQINLSMKIYDEMKIHIYEEGEVATSNVNQAELSDQTQQNQIVNINTASLEQLMTLPGIGETRANEIINYRLQKSFDSIEDIKEISGIGDKSFEKIKNYITVDWN